MSLHQFLCIYGLSYYSNDLLDNLFLHDVKKIISLGTMQPESQTSVVLKLNYGGMKCS